MSSPFGPFALTVWPSIFAVTPFGTGTGFFVSTDGRIITNHHVIEGGSRITATLSDGSKRAILGVLASDEPRDEEVEQMTGVPPASKELSQM